MDIALENLDEVYIEGYNLSLYSYENMVKIAGDIIIKESKLDQSKMSQPGWLNDSRMGTLSLTEECATCSGQNCPGHLGLIEFGKGNEILHPVVARDIIKVWNCVCPSCSNLLFANELPGKSGKDVMSEELKKILKKTDVGARLSALEKYCVAKIDCCPMKCRDDKKGIKKCAPLIKLKALNLKDNGIIQYDVINKNKDKSKSKDDGKVKTIFTSTIYTVFKNISHQDQQYLGFEGETRPVDLIMRGLFVLPPLARTPITDKNGESIQNPITVFYSDVIKAVNNKNNAPGEIYKAVRALLLKNDNNKKGGQETKSIGELMQGKKGIYRMATKGKRGDWCARTVADPGDHLRFGQSELPEEWKYILSKSSKVTNFNIKAYQVLVETDRISHIINNHGLREPINRNALPKLQIGQEVEVRLKEGDRITLNRQPSLHKGSMQGFEITFGKAQVIKNHLSITSPLNLDHDGDEVNVWVPRDYEVEAEIEYLMNTKNCIISTENGKAQMGLVMNSVTASYLLSLPNVEMEESLYLDLIGSITNKESLPTLHERLSKFGFELYRTDIQGKKHFSGRAALSALFPSDFEYRIKGVVIMQGILISGILTKSHVGPSSRSIIQELVKHYSIDRAADFLTDAPHLLNIYIVNRGFTVGINDCVNMVVDSKAELYNKQYNKYAEIFQDEYDRMKRIVFSKKSLSDIKSLSNEVDQIIKNVLANSTDLSYNKYLTTNHQSFNNIVKLTEQENMTCRAETINQIMQDFQSFFKAKLNYKKELHLPIDRYFEVINLLPNQLISEELYIKLKMIINSIKVSYILAGEDKSLDDLLLKLNNLPIAKDVDSINQVIYNILKSLPGKSSKTSNVNLDRQLISFEKLLKKYKQEGVSNVYYYNKFKDLENGINESGKSKMVNQFLEESILQPYLRMSIKNDISETTKNINALYESILQKNNEYDELMREFITKTYQNILQCNKSKNVENAILGIFNEKLLILLSLLYKNLVNTLNREYNKNFVIKKEELAKVLLDVEAIGSKKGLSQEEQNYKENLLMEKVNVAKSIGVILAKSSSKSNAIIAQTEEGAGTKGSSANVGQIKASVGQQYMSGKRLWSKADRLSSHYDRDDETPQARGLVESSFYEGLTPTEMFYIQAAGRENVIETYLKTPVLGKMERFLQRSLENIIVAYDGSVRNTNGFLYTSSYNAGFDIAKTLNVGTADKPLLSSFIDLNKVIDEENHKRGWYTRSELTETNVKIKPTKLSLEDAFTDMLNDEVTFESVIIDSKYKNIEDKLTLYEKARIIGVRAQMLNNNDVPRVDIGELTDAMDIAKLEYSEGALANEPAIVIRRTFPDGRKKDIYPTLENIL
jgi:DNA-directed RNA polymerase beta' subunit/DNA-directed RNA polymerase subunit K/omega